MRLNRALLSSPNFQRLLISVGDREKAIAALAELFILAQDYWLPNKHPVPLIEMQDSELPVEALVKHGFLVKEPEGFFMVNSEETFAYYFAYNFNETWFKKWAGSIAAQSPNFHAVRGEDGRFIPKEEIGQIQRTVAKNTSGKVNKAKTTRQVNELKKKTAKKTKKKTTRKKKSTKKVAPATD